MKKEFTKSEAYGIMTTGIMMLLMFPIIETNYGPLLIFDIVGVAICLLLISAGAYLVWRAKTKVQ